MGPPRSKNLRAPATNFENVEHFYVFVDASAYVACIFFLLRACMTVDRVFQNPEYAVLSYQRVTEYLV